jgi:hypothetical protein
MEKKRYYISLHNTVGNVEIRDEKGTATYDFEIEATDTDIEQLEKWLNNADHSEFLTFVHPHIMPFSEAIDRDHEKYDQALGQVYQMIYNLGTVETRAQIEDMGILDALKGSAGQQETEGL